jgi:hypothetical protein
MAFSDARSAPADLQSIANDDPSRETQGPSMAPRPTRQDGQSSQMEETSAAKRFALKLAGRCMVQS